MLSQIATANVFLFYSSDALLILEKNKLFNTCLFIKRTLFIFRQKLNKIWIKQCVFDFFLNFNFHEICISYRVADKILNLLRYTTYSFFLRFKHVISIFYKFINNFLLLKYKWPHNFRLIMRSGSGSLTILIWYYSDLCFCWVLVRFMQFRYQKYWCKIYELYWYQQTVTYLSQHSQNYFSF